MKANILEKIISKIPYIRYAYYYRQNCQYRPGYFYSPVVDLEELENRAEKIWRPRSLKGIDLNDPMQQAVWESIVDFSKVIPFEAHPDPLKFRYYYENKTFQYTDGLVLFSILMKNKPGRVIEVGSGFSSSLMLDTNDKLLNNSIKFTFIEPNPEISLNKLLRKEDYQNTVVKNEFVQDVDPAIFSTLKENDILFIDNSHVSKTGSDVNYLMTEILPVLNKGVIIHIHDIFYPFEYPKDWLFEHKLNWNEIYSVHNFLLFNNAFKIVFFSDYMQQKLRPEYESQVPLFFKDRPGSIWLRKIV
jgi:hypothetical protein